jgi:hypothetical protein
MPAFAAIAGGIALVVGWIVTARLFALARRTGAPPERVLAIAFSGLFCVGYPLSAVSRMPGLVETNEGSLLFTIGMIGVGIGTTALCGFPQLVFRPGRRWALWLRNGTAVGGLVAVAGCAVAVATAADRAQMIEATRPWALGVVGAIGIPFLWNAIESTLYYRRMRRRLAIGLADPVTTHRFLLWALASWVSSAQVVAIALLRGVGIPTVSPLPMSIIAIAALVSSCCWWLAFLMPTAYQARIAAESHARQQGAS